MLPAAISFLCIRASVPAGLCPFGAYACQLRIRVSLSGVFGLGLARQGIEPWSTDYETAALPLSYRAPECGLRFDTTLFA